MKEKIKTRQKYINKHYSWCIYIVTCLKYRNMTTEDVIGTVFEYLTKLKNNQLSIHGRMIQCAVHIKY